MAKSNAVAEKDQNAVALFGSERPDYITDTARGSEGVSTDDMSLPRLTIIQDLSPQRKKSEDAYIEGAEEGMIFNTASNELFPSGEIVVIPCYFRAEYVAWKDRKKGGGFGGAFASEQEAEDWISEQDDAADWEAQYSNQHFCILVHPDHTPEKPHLEDVVISMSKTQLKPSRKWNTMIQSAGGDRFSRAYRLTVIQESNNKGSFYNWSVKQLGYVPESLFKKAESVYEAVKAGQKDVSRDVGGSRVDKNDMGHDEAGM